MEVGSFSRQRAAVAHISDIHFGRLTSEGIVDALVDDIHEAHPNLVVISGDLTQRARRSQFRDAAGMIESFNTPVMVVPGNHDIPAWYRPWTRVFSPLGRYAEHISPEMQPTFEGDGLAVAGINTAHRMTIKGGKIRPEQVAFVRSFFKDADPASFKVLVLHHPPVALTGQRFPEVARASHLAVDMIGSARVDLVLCGHLHQSSIESVPLGSGHSVVIASAGTASSSRGRGSDRRTNIYNIVRIDNDYFDVEERRFDLASHRFERLRKSSFART